MPEVSVRPATADDAEFVSRTLRDSWGATEVVADGRLYDASAQPATLLNRAFVPVLPTHAADGTPIRDEWVLERDLRGDRDA
jgi:hypothetical protein